MESHPRLEEMQFELISALSNASREYQIRMLERVLEKVLSLKRDFRAQPAASDSPSQSEKPSEPSTCEAGESAGRDGFEEWWRGWLGTGSPDREVVARAAWVAATTAWVQSAPREVADD